jgi:aryl-alcohol dehydrogenase-like predicted oxidoreductase
MVPFNITTSQVAEKLFPVVRKNKIAVVGMKSLAARGFLNVDINPADYGRDVSLPIAAIKWVLQSPEISCTIPAMNAIEEVEENVRASGSALTDEEIKMLNDVKDKFNEMIEKEDRSWYFFRDWVKNLSLGRP